MNVNQIEALLPEDLMELGREMGKDMVKSYWNELTTEEKVSEFGVESILELFSLEQRMAGLSPQDVLPLFDPDDIEAYLQHVNYKNSGR